jgi:alkylation response protein AidB-like acyl-CoA dehydrogenase
MTWPKRYGGQERSYLERFVVTEEMLAAAAPCAAHWFGDRQIGPSLLRHGPDHLKERFLPAIARGECAFALGMSEPNSGSDLASVRTRAERVAAVGASGRKYGRAGRTGRTRSSSSVAPLPTAATATKDCRSSSSS